MGKRPARPRVMIKKDTRVTGRSTVRARRPERTGRAATSWRRHGRRADAARGLALYRGGVSTSRARSHPPHRPACTRGRSSRSSCSRRCGGSQDQRARGRILVQYEKSSCARGDQLAELDCGAFIKSTFAFDFRRHDNRRASIGTRLPGSISSRTWLAKVLKLRPDRANGSEATSRAAVAELSGQLRLLGLDRADHVRDRDQGAAALRPEQSRDRGQGRRGCLGSGPAGRRDGDPGAKHLEPHDARVPEARRVARALRDPYRGAAHEHQRLALAQRDPVLGRGSAAR